jgi:hypothetical protein
VYRVENAMRFPVLHQRPDKGFLREKVTMSSKLRLILSTATIAALAGCMGSGGSGGNAPAFTSFNDVPADGSAQLKGQARTASMSESGNGVTVGAISDPTDASVTVTYAGGDLTKEAVNAAGSNLSWDTANGDTVETGPEGTAFVSRDKNSAIYQANPQSSGYNYQSYGAWVASDGKGGSVGVASVGAPTPASGLPSAQQATYNGQSVGFAADTRSGVAVVTTSNITVTTDFNTVNVNSSGTQLRDVETGNYVSGGSNLDFSATGTVSGNGFSANIAPTATLGDGGTATGSFYGPGAQEAGGTFAASGANATYMGAFGGKQ